MSRSSWPPIPLKIRGAGGPIKVKLLKRVTLEKRGDCWGLWNAGTRQISLEKGALPQHRWRTLFHELTHAAIDDAGVGNLLSAEAVESLCDAMATARIQEMRGLLEIPE